MGRRDWFGSFPMKEVAPWDEYHGQLQTSLALTAREIYLSEGVAGAFGNFMFATGGRFRADATGFEPILREGRSVIDLRDLPLAALRASVNELIEISAINRSSEPKKFAAAVVTSIDPLPGEREPYEKVEYESGPVAVAPGTSATLVVARNMELPFKVEGLNLVVREAGDMDVHDDTEVSVMGLKVGKWEQLAAPPVPWQVLHGCPYGALAVQHAMPGEEICMLIMNTGSVEAIVNLKLEGVELNEKSASPRPRDEVSKELRKKLEEYVRGKGDRNAEGKDKKKL